MRIKNTKESNEDNNSVRKKNTLFHIYLRLSFETLLYDHILYYDSNFYVSKFYATKYAFSRICTYIFYAKNNDCT